MGLTEAEQIEKELLTRELVTRNRDNKEFRLTSWLVYKIKLKSWKIIPYKPNRYQRRLQTTQHYRNIILKARQLGFSTDIDVQALDFALTHNWVNVGIIAHNREGAEEIFRDKVVPAYENLPKNIKDQDKYQLVTDSSRALSFKNWSRISVSTWFRWWTLQFLHISEFWKICAKYPEKAREIVTGAIEALAIDWYLFIESTAEGNEWKFYDFFTEAWNDMLLKRELTNLDLKPYFFARWENENNVLPEESQVLITMEDINYFKSIQEKCHMILSLWQKKWYVKKKMTLKDDMWREHPSFWEEAFDLAVEWAYFERELALMRRQQRIWEFPWNPNKPVYCARDLGWFWGWDEMADIFYQKNWERIDIIDYEEATWYSIEEFQLEFVTPKWYRITEDWFPHDAKRTESNGKTVANNAKSIGIPVKQLEIWWVRDWINECKRMFYRIRINEKTCTKFIKVLSNYRRERDKKLWRFMDKPLHNWASHGADAFRYMIMSFKEEVQWPKEKRTKTVWNVDKWWFVEIPA